MIELRNCGGRVVSEARVRRRWGEFAADGVHLLQRAHKLPGDASVGLLRRSIACQDSARPEQICLFAGGHKLRDKEVVGQGTGTAQVQLVILRLCGREPVKRPNTPDSTSKSGGGNDSRAKARRTGPSPAPMPAGPSNSLPADCCT